MKSRSADAQVLVFISFLIIYLLTLTSNFTAPHDSMTYLLMLKEKEHLWHVHHLLYHQLSYYWLAFWKSIFPGVQDYLIVETISSLFGAGTVTISFLFLRRRFQLPRITSWLGAGVIAFSYGIWFYSVNVEVYAPSLFFSFWMLYVVTKKQWNAKDLWFSALLHSIAILFHQMNILILPIILYKIFEQRKNIYVYKSILWYAITGVVLVGGVYFLAGRYGEGKTDFSSWFSWVQGYTSGNEYWRPLSIKTPVLAAVGFSHTFLGGHFFFRLGLESWFASLLSSHSLGDEIFLSRSIPIWVDFIMFALTPILLFLSVILFIRFIKKFRALIRTQSSVIIPLLLYFLINSFYFLFWVPEILEFWLGQCIVFWLLIIGTYEPINKKSTLIIGSIMSLLFTINYVSSIRPMQNPNNDIGYVRVEKIKELAKKDDLIIVQDKWLLKEFLEYYTDAKVVIVPTIASEQVAVLAELQQKLDAGKTIYIFPETRSENASPDKNFIPTILNKHKERSRLIQKEYTEIWEIR